MTAEVPDPVALRRDLVSANHILAREEILDTHGHVSVRDPEDPSRFVMSCSRAPALVSEMDLLTFNMDGHEVTGDSRQPYGERFIHAAIYGTRPEVQAICHCHTPSLVTFSIVNVPLRPAFHMATTPEYDIPVWDIADEFGPTDMLVHNLPMGRSLAKTLGAGRIALMRGHGAVVVGQSIAEIVTTVISADQNARILKDAYLLGSGQVHVLSQEENARALKSPPAPMRYERGWEGLRARVEE